MSNPFLANSELNGQLQLELCQRIHFAALQSAAQGRFQNLPPTLNVGEIKALAYIAGASAYLFHPKQVEAIFKGVTLGVYQEIDRLYCSRLGRSVEMISKILDAMAKEAQAKPVTFEAVWAICLYLDERRRSLADVTVKREEKGWWLFPVSPNVWLKQRQSVALAKPTLLSIVDAQTMGVLAFRVCTQESLEQASRLVIYDAIAAQRKPSTESRDGLIWFIPTRLETALVLEPDKVDICANLGIEVTDDDKRMSIIEDLQHSWWRDISGRVLSENELAMFFDNYLYKSSGFSPLRSRTEMARECVNLNGYSKDPAGQFPALRALLPISTAFVDSAGRVRLDGLTYEDPLLRYWIGQEVQVRRSAHFEATAWIYVNNDVLCEAKARELQRTNGSYRANRPGV